MRRSEEAVSPEGEAGQRRRAGDASPSVVEAMRQMPTRRREALILRYYAALDLEQIADAMGVSPSTARMHMERGAEELLLLLDSLTSEPSPREHPPQLALHGERQADADRVP
jgi:RNA polymerase sigma factor (sigma-70 family)